MRVMMRMVAYAFLRRECAFVGIADEILDSDVLYLSGLVCNIHSLNGFYNRAVLRGFSAAVLSTDRRNNPTWPTDNTGTLHR